LPPNIQQLLDKLPDFGFMLATQLVMPVSSSDGGSFNNLADGDGFGGFGNVADSSDFGSFDNVAAGEDFGSFDKADMKAADSGDFGSFDNVADSDDFVFG